MSPRDITLGQSVFTSTERRAHDLNLNTCATQAYQRTHRCLHVAVPAHPAEEGEFSLPLAQQPAPRATPPPVAPGGGCSFLLKASQVITAGELGRLQLSNQKRKGEVVNSKSINYNNLLFQMSRRNIFQIPLDRWGKCSP